ncbi:uncharacterized protein LOC142170294 [Nicotiana tabacum]|uniref:Uncharacterized protein LOC142170294 n=1 Tax=Nicotiana tabacum TaxID=4097 RepID=A0AC58STK8_TOBAC
MKTYLEALHLREVVEEDYDVLPLPSNPTMAQRVTRKRKPRKTKKSKAKATLFAGVSATIFTRVMALKSAKEIWDYLKGEYTRDERIRSMKVLNLIREFELQKMKESETVKEYSDRLFGIVTKIRLLGRQKTTIRKLEAQLSQVVGVFNAQQANIEDSSQEKHEFEMLTGEHCGKKGHPLFKCWKRLDAKCKICNQLGHEALICKGKSQKHKADAQVANEEEEDHLFVATLLSTKKFDFWMTDSGCTNHMTYDRNLFKEFKSMENKKVRIGNGDYILVKGKRTVAIPTKSVFFEDKHCFIYDATGIEILRVKMGGKNFLFNPTKDEKWSQKNLQSADNSPNEHICENEAKKKLSIFQTNKIWKKLDKPQGKMKSGRKLTSLKARCK